MLLWSCSAGKYKEGGYYCRRLILMRHSESEPAAPGLRDYDRPITAEGAAAAQQVARQLKERGWVPQVVLCSNALRTRQVRPRAQWGDAAAGLRRRRGGPPR